MVESLIMKEDASWLRELIVKGQTTTRAVLQLFLRRNDREHQI